MAKKTTTKKTTSKKKTTKKNSTKEDIRMEEPMEKKPSMKTPGKKEIPKSSKNQSKPLNEPKKKDGSDFWDKIISIDRKKATKFIIGGLIFAIVFGIIGLTSNSLAQNASDWENYQLHENDLGYWQGEYGYQEYLERDKEIYSKADWMRFQEAIFENIARIGVDVGLVCVMLGFIGYSADEEMDPKKRQLSFILAALIITIVMFTTLSTGVTISIG